MLVCNLLVLVLLKGLTASADHPSDVDVREPVGELVDVDDAVAGNLLPVGLTLQPVHRVGTITCRQK
jgi:hypothetical protein